MRKEYNDRWNASLVNPCFTLPEYEASKANGFLRSESLERKFNAKIKESVNYFEEIANRSEAIARAKS